MGRFRRCCSNSHRHGDRAGRRVRDRRSSDELGGSATRRQDGERMGRASSFNGLGAARLATLGVEKSRRGFSKGSNGTQGLQGAFGSHRSRAAPEIIAVSGQVARSLQGPCRMAWRHLRSASALARIFVSASASAPMFELRASLLHLRHLLCRSRPKAHARMYVVVHVQPCMWMSACVVLGSLSVC